MVLHSTRFAVHIDLMNQFARLSLRVSLDFNEPFFAWMCLLFPDMTVTSTLCIMIMLLLECM